MAYDLMYRYGAPWDAVGVREELREFLDGGHVTPATHARAIDLGCGTGANVVFLAEQGFEAHGVDLSEVALAKAVGRARSAGVSGRVRFVEGDLTGPEIPGLEGPFDLLLDFGTLDDLRAAGRRAMADLVTRLSRPGSVLLLWCFYGAREDLPWFSFHGPSRLAPAIEPGEVERLFGEHFEIRPGPRPRTVNPAACFVLTRRPRPGSPATT
jgi:SAM-dependent methyltransferase